MVVTLAVSALVLASGAEIVHAKNAKINYQVKVQRTSFGIPHVRASDWGSLGYGYGYAFAQDNICVLAADVLVATGTKSRFFGPQGGNLASDFVYALINADALVRSA
jgi:acyl-homoserine-lactone acylase